MKIQPVQRQKIAEAVIEQLKDLIKNGTYPPGSKLPSEKDLAQQFGVSRASIREALSVLAATKILETRQGGGSFVQTVGLQTYIPSVAASLVSFPKDLLHLIEIRMTLETAASELAAQRAREEHLSRMEAALQNYMEEFQAGKIGDESDLDFHQAIAVATGNPVLVEMMRHVSDLIKEGMHYTLQKNIGNKDRIHEVYSEHSQILSAIKQHDSLAARLAMTVHLQKVREKVQRLIDVSNN